MNASCPRDGRTTAGGLVAQHGTDLYTAVGLIDWESQTPTVPVRGATAEQGFMPAVQLGVHHIAGGANHLLFLLMLLVGTRTNAREWSDLSTPVRGSRRGKPVNLRWILTHLIEEYARHLGHMDLLREFTDGRTGY